MFLGIDCVWHCCHFSSDGSCCTTIALSLVAIALIAHKSSENDANHVATPISRSVEGRIGTERFEAILEVFLGVLGFRIYTLSAVATYDALALLSSSFLLQYYAAVRALEIERIGSKEAEWSM